MLALTRKIGEKIMIGDNIEIIIADIKGENVRLAINAPKEVKIFRGEIYEAIINENKKAASAGNPDLLERLNEISKINSK